MFILGLCLLLAKLVIDSMHEHMWSEATCTAPMQCIECGEIAGNPLGHEWQDATCTTAMTCSICGEINGEIGGHNWVEASCDSPKTCRTCGITEGESLEHELEDGKCTRCSKQMYSLTKENWETYFTWKVEWLGSTDARITVTPNSGYRFSEGSNVYFIFRYDGKNVHGDWVELGAGLRIDIDKNGAQTSQMFSDIEGDVWNERKLKRVYIKNVTGYIITD